LSFAEISKKLAQEWSQLDATEKQAYVKKAEEDKERYNREFADYQRTDAYKQFVAAQKEKEKSLLEANPSGSAAAASGGSKKKKKSASKDKNVKVEEEANPGSPSSGNFLDIPIFREDFLEHNKSREAELKQLRKQVRLN
jgi:hypothetical protein